MFCISAGLCVGVRGGVCLSSTGTKREFKLMMV